MVMSTILSFTYVGADMKYLGICLGIEAANSTYSCIWPADERHDSSKSWSTVDESARTIDEIQKLALNINIVIHTLYNVFKATPSVW